MDRISRATRQTAIGTDAAFVVIVGTPGYEPTIVIYGRRDRHKVEAKLREESYEEVIETFRRRGYEPEMPPDDLDLDDRNGRSNIRAIDEIARGRSHRIFELELSADRSAHRIDPAYARAVNRVARRLRPLRREDHRHRSAAEFERMAAARSAGVTVTGWLEWRLRMDSHWSGEIGLDAHGAGEMTWAGDLLLERSAVHALSDLGRGEVLVRAAATHESVSGQYHILTLLHEMTHSLSSIRSRSFEALPGIEEGITELIAVSAFPRFMADTFGVRTDRPKITTYALACRTVRTAWELVRRDRGDWAEAEFYADIYVEPSNAGRYTLIARALRREGVDAATIDALIDRFSAVIADTD